MYDLIIVGGGVVAFSAAIYAGRYHMKTLILGESIGGTLMLTTEIENYPGFESISGMDLFDKVKKHAEKYNDYIESKQQKVETIEKTGKFFSVQTTDGKYEAKSLLIATGTKWRKLKVPGEKEFTGNGVHYCATCDGFIYNDKIVAVVGGSDSAAKEALLLTNYAKKVYIIYRKENIRAEPITVKRVKENSKIEIINNSNVTEIVGDKIVKNVILDREYNRSKEFPVDGLFIEIGHIPLSDITKGIGVKINDKKEILIDKNGKTNVDGVFAAGDITDNSFKQVITGVGQGVIAINSVYEYLESLK
jgi:thioredoxin reductase (NADPH)